MISARIPSDAGLGYKVLELLLDNAARPSVKCEIRSACAMPSRLFCRDFVARAAYPAKAEGQQAQPSATSRTEAEKADPTESRVLTHTLSPCQVRHTGASDVHRRWLARQGRLDMRHGRGLISRRTPTSTSESVHFASCMAQVLFTPSVAQHCAQSRCRASTSHACFMGSDPATWTWQWPRKPDLERVSLDCLQGVPVQSGLCPAACASQDTNGMALSRVVAPRQDTRLHAAPRPEFNYRFASLVKRRRRSLPLAPKPLLATALERDGDPCSKHLRTRQRQHVVHESPTAEQVAACRDLGTYSFVPGSIRLNLLGTLRQHRHRERERSGRDRRT